MAAEMSVCSHGMDGLTGGDKVGRKGGGGKGDEGGYVMEVMEEILHRER